MDTRRLPTLFVVLIVALFAMFGLAAASGDKVKLHVSSPALADRLLSEFGGRLVADYGSYRLIQVDGAAAADLANVPGQFRCDEYDHIALNTGWIPTAPGVAPARKSTVDIYSGKRLHMVQFAGPIQPQWFEALQATGAQVVTYLPYNAYLVYVDSAALGRLKGLVDTRAFMQWEGDYLPDYKIQPGIMVEDRTKDEPMPDAFGIQLVKDAKANAETLALVEKFRLGAIREDFEFLGYRNLTVLIPEERLGQLALRPDVVSIQPWFEPALDDERQNQIMRNYLTGNSPTGPGYLDWLLGLGFTQQQFTTSGFAVDVTDSGIDNATTSPNHFALYVEGVRPGTSRVIYNRLEGTPHTPSTLEGCDGHGNLNAHIVAGYNNLTGAYHEDASGFNYGLGVCPWVKVGSSVIFDPNTYTSPNLPNLQSKAYNDGARISTNSWGAAVGGSYNTNAQTFDGLVRDAQPTGSTYPVAGNQEMVIVFSAGNSGSGANTIGSPGTGKNIFTIGAAENVNPFGGNDQCGWGDSDSDSANDVATYSSRGPCDDGRVKPDIQAPGTHCTGGVAQVASPPAQGDANACYTANGVCGGPAASPDFWPAGQEWTTSSTGTSHSCPAVSGAAALLRQWFINKGWAPPSPAMTKAWLMNTTRYMTGAYANDTLPSNHQGMGETDLTRAFDDTYRLLIDQTQVFEATGETRVITGNIPDSDRPLRVTLAWTDAPGPTTGNAYLNNLDLEVIAGGQTYYGNVFSGALSTPGGSPDLKNNVECVFLPAGLRGSFVVTVRATNINSDGVPNNQTAIDQDYALVIYNGEEVFQPVITGQSATLEVEGCNPGNDAPDPDETVTYDITLKNVGSASTTNLVATLLATGGVTSPSTPQNFGALDPDMSATRSFTFTVDPSLACGDNVTLTFTLDDDGTDLGSVQFNLVTGALAPLVVIFTENFDGVTAPALPTGWAIVDTQGTEGAWATATATVHPSAQPPHSAPNLVYFNSYTAHTGHDTRLYRTTGLDLSAYPGALTTVKFWMYHDTGYTSNTDRVQVQVSTDGGTNWINVGTPVNRYNGTTGWAQHTVDLSAYSGLADVRLGLNGISNYGNDVHVDDVTIDTQSRECCESAIPVGDLNHDMLVDGADLLILASYLGGADLPVGTNVSECELVTDGAVNAADLAWLQNKVAGNI